MIGDNDAKETTVRGRYSRLKEENSMQTSKQASKMELA
jgi:hypothetical protein